MSGDAMYVAHVRRREMIASFWATFGMNGLSDRALAEQRPDDC
jgi:hypothetical protein